MNVSERLKFYGALKIMLNFRNASLNVNRSFMKKGRYQR